MRPGKPLRNHARCILVAAALFTAAAGFSQSMRYPGELGPGDTKLGKENFRHIVIKVLTRVQNCLINSGIP